MNIATIEELAYIMKEAKENNLPGSIFFLGAGASRTGGIPLANEINEDILERYSKNPKIKSLKSEDYTYPKLMNCLSPNERNKLLKGYIDSAKINVTHMYLAQLMKYGFVDYVLTVNFDNLMQRALALFNEFPPTYDMAILKDLTTTAFKVKSVVYLHGQHHGLWLLNTEEEMTKVTEIVTQIFDSIKNERPWIFIGYGGEDPIFDHIKRIARFDNGLFWVSHYDNDPCSTVCKGLLEKPLTNASLIKGYDADSFMLKLNRELDLPEPLIIDKPFTSLKGMLNNLKDIDDKDHFNGVRQRVEIAKEQVNEAIQQFEMGKTKSSDKIKKNTEIDLLKKEIIDLIIKEDYTEDKIREVSIKARALDKVNIDNLLSSLYSNWGNKLGRLAKVKTGQEAESLYHQVFEKYSKAIEIKPDNHNAYYNWGTALGNLADTKTGNEAETLYQQAFEKFSKAIEINPDEHNAFNNWGTDLGKLAGTKTGDESETLYQQAFEKFGKAIEIKPDKHEAYSNWGTYIGKLASTKTAEKAETLYLRAFEKYIKAIEIKPDKHEVLYKWGTDLGKLAETKTGEEAESLNKEALEKFSNAIEIKPDKHEAFNNWGIVLGHLAETKTGDEAETLYQQAFEKFSKAIELEPNKQGAFINWGNNLCKLAETKKVGEAEILYNQAFKKFSKAIEISSNNNEAFNNWGICLDKLAKTKRGKEAEILNNQAIEKYSKAIEFGGRSYNLACRYALKADKKNALYYLNLSLKNKEIETESVVNDEYWIKYLEDENFKEITARYSNS